jgi:hypothetical protein
MLLCFISAPLLLSAASTAWCGAARLLQQAFLKALQEQARVIVS